MPARPRILIADNDLTNVQLLSDICATEDLEVIVAQDGDETLKVISEDPPDLVLLDVMMPGRDGFEVLRELRTHAATGHLPVIMVTAVSDDDSIRQGYQIGADDYLTKPFKVVELIARMKTLLGASAYAQLKAAGVHWEVGDHKRLLHTLEEELTRAVVQPFVLLMFQLLHLDAIEQRHDGATAKSLMRTLAARLRARLRGVDSAHFLPPDLLAFVLVATEENGAAAVAERLVDEVRRPVSLGQLSFTLDARWSTTVATTPDLAKPSDLVQQCINRLTQAD